MGAYDGYYLYCDLDGTLYDDNKRVSAENRAAIHSFVEQGGRFGIATGRVPTIIGGIAGDLPVNAPCILYNGAGLYDLNNQSFLAVHAINHSLAERVCSRAIALSGNACPQIFTQDGIYETNPNQRDDPQTIIEHMKTIHTSIDRVPRPFLKFLIAHESDELDRMQIILEEEGYYDGFSVFRSSEAYLEFVKEGVNKGSALADVRSRCGDVKKILAIGDYNNDLEMVSLADIGGAPANAIDAVKNVANIVLTASNNESCVARFLEAALK